MAKFISVLNSDFKKSYWKAVQWDDDKDSLTANPYYTAGVNMQVPKSEGDTLLGTKKITETSTQLSGTATLIKLAANTANTIKLAYNSAPKSFTQKFDV